MKDVLREMKELKPASSDPMDEEASDEVSINAESGPHDSDDNSCYEDDLGNDLSEEEMKIAQFSINAMSEMLMVVKELIHYIKNLKEDPDGVSDSVSCLEKLLKLFQGIGAQFDELGAGLYPPQEISDIKAASEKLSTMVDEMQVELGKLDSSLETALKACTGLRESLRLLDSELDCSYATDLLPKIENLVLSS